MRLATLPLACLFAICGQVVLLQVADADVVITWPTFPGSGLDTQTATFKQNSLDPFSGESYTGTEDTWVHLNGPGSTEHRNAGADGRIIMGGIGAGPNDERHQFIRFDLSSMAGQFATIESVTLRLYWHVSPLGSDTVQLFPVSEANAGWVEGNSLTGADTIVPGESTWNNLHHPATPWAGSPGASTAGVDYVDTVLASASYDGSETAGSSFDLVFNDPSIILSWMGGQNAGIYGRTIGQDEQAIFRSSEYEGFEPELIITYTTGLTTVVPEPSSLALLCLGGMVLGVVSMRRRSQN